MRILLTLTLTMLLGSSRAEDLTKKYKTALSDQAYHEDVFKLVHRNMLNFWNKGLKENKTTVVSLAKVLMWMDGENNDIEMDMNYLKQNLSGKDTGYKPSANSAKPSELVELLLDRKESLKNKAAQNVYICLALAVDPDNDKLKAYKTKLGSNFDPHAYISKATASTQPAYQVKKVILPFKIDDLDKLTVAAKEYRKHLFTKVLSGETKDLRFRGEFDLQGNCIDLQFSKLNNDATEMKDLYESVFAGQFPVPSKEEIKVLAKEHDIKFRVDQTTCNLSDASLRKISSAKDRSFQKKLDSMINPYFIRLGYKHNGLRFEGGLPNDEIKWRKYLQECSKLGDLNLRPLKKFLKGYPRNDVLEQKGYQGFFIKGNITNETVNFALTQICKDFSMEKISVLQDRRNPETVKYAWGSKKLTLLGYPRAVVEYMEGKEGYLMVYTSPTLGYRGLYNFYGVLHDMDNRVRFTLGNSLR